MIWQVLILAGSRRGAEDPVAMAAGVSHKAFVPIAGQPMIEHVINTLEAVPEIGKIAVSIENDAVLTLDDVTRLDAMKSPAASVLGAINMLGTPLLVTTADNPLISAQSISRFLNDVSALKTDAAAGICHQSIVEQAGNPGKRTYLRFRDGAVSGCNLFAFSTPESAAAAGFWLSLEADRKKPWRMASRIGLGLLCRYVTGSLDHTAAAEAVGNAAGCKAALVKVDDIYAAHDVDKPEDLVFAQRCINDRSPHVQSS